ncbi:MAG: enoyl-CoA hydratase/isomerase family protein [Myxococcales bacterium]|nr:enoyl-CoA hydratase/isomerase family protein [Myxococcales bacterium]
MTVELKKRGGVWTLWLARPGKHNAFHGEMLGEIEAAITAAERESSCRVLVLAGQGKSFCAGADLGWMAAQAKEGAQANLASAERMGGIFHRLSQCAKPTIARVHGAAMGGGVGLASACDFVVATERAFFALSEVRLGLVPGVISPFVVRRVGPAKARALFMLGDRVPGAEALTLGLADRCVAHDSELLELDAAVAKLTAKLLRGGPHALQACKALVDGVQYQDPGAVLAFTARAISERRASDEARAGMAAFLNKKPAPWIPTADESGGAA